MIKFVQKVWGFHRKDALKPSARIIASAALCLLTGLGLSAAVWLINSQSIRETLLAMLRMPLQFYGAALFLALCMWALSSLSRSLFFGGTIISLVSVVSAFVNYFKMLITSTPLELQDLFLIGKLGNIAQLNSEYITLGRNSCIAIMGVLLWLAVLWFFSKPLRTDKKGAAGTFAVSVLSFILIFVLCADALFYAPLGVSLTNGHGQSYVNGQTGFVLGFWRSVLYKDEMESIYTPENALDTQKRIQDLIRDIPENGSGEKANVILLLSESFFDVTRLPGVEYENDPIEAFHDLQTQGVSGTFYTRTLGYGTCNIELELLSGVNTRLFPTKGALNTWKSPDFEKLPAIPQVLAQQGYYTAFLHMFNDSIYNRKAFLSGLGFQDIFFSEDLALIDPDAEAAGLGYWEYLEGKIDGGFYSDDYMTDVIIDLFEQKKDDGHVFIYAVSMENHSPYTGEKYSEYDYPFSSALSGDAVGSLNAATQGIANASKALEKLTDYLKTVSEPTVVVFFGDHKPGLGLETVGNVYSELGMCPADSLKWTAEDYVSLYSADYLIWANDPALLPAEPGTKADTSSNYLGLDVLNVSNAHKPDYWQIIESLREDSLISCPNYYMDAEGSASLDMPRDNAAAEKYDLFKFVLYDAYHQRYLTDRLS